jgi:HlyD family secretion protein
VWALRPQPIIVETAQVVRGPFEQTVSDDGKTRVRDRYVVSAPLAGRVERSRWRSGDPVEQGQTVAILTPAVPAFIDARTQAELQARVAGAEAQRMRAAAELDKARAQLEHARADVARTEKLAGQGFVSANAREDMLLAQRTAEKAVDAARFAEEAARHDIAQARAALVRYRAEGAGSVLGAARWEVKSPIRGSVLKVAQESEAAVPLGAPLVEIADPRSLEVIVDVLSQEAVNIRPGMAARVDVGTAAPFAARVRRVEPAAFTKVSALGVEEQRVNVVLDFTEDLDRIQVIGDSFRVDASIIVHRVEDAVKAPVGALFRDGPGWAVFVIEGKRAVKRPVRTTRRNGVEALVDEGLSQGATVVVYPSDALKDGARIEVKGGGAKNH